MAEEEADGIADFDFVAEHRLSLITVLPNTVAGARLAVPSATVLLMR